MHIYIGEACNRLECPGAVVDVNSTQPILIACSGRGRCLSMEHMAKDKYHYEMPSAGEIQVGQTIAGSGITAGTTIVSMLNTLSCHFMAIWDQYLLNVLVLTSGNLAVGQTVTGIGVPADTTITALGTGLGGVGTYTLSNSLGRKIVVPVLLTSTDFEAVITASWAASTAVLTVTAVTSGSISVGHNIRGSGISPGTTITALMSGTGGVGTYTMSSMQGSAGTAATVTAYLTGNGGIGTYRMSVLQAAAGTQRLVTSSTTANGVTTAIVSYIAKWTAISKILTVTDVQQNVGYIFFFCYVFSIELA